MSTEPIKRDATDEAEPTAGRGSAPMILIIIFGLLVYWGMVYLDAHGGGFDSQVYRPYESYADVKDHQPPTIGGPDLNLGKQVFQTCAACHQPDGKGSAALNAPPLAGSDWAQAEGPNRVVRIVLNGLSGPITVSGAQFGAGAMPAFKDAFSDEQIAAVLSYVRQEWGNKAGSVKPEEVKAIRAKEASKGDAWNSADLLKIPDKD
jgi:mono/diheme cytochrome c family protein